MSDKFPLVTNAMLHLKLLPVLILGFAAFCSADYVPASYPSNIYQPNSILQVPTIPQKDAASHQLEDWAAAHPAGSQGLVRDDQGYPVPSLTASQSIGRHGELLLQDVFLINKLAAFNRERIPERVVHAKGHGAFGKFTVTNDISKYTRADFLNGIGKKTRILVRFSTVGGESGTPDLEREGRGFAIKFYTADGICDIVGNFAGAFPIRDGMLFGDLNKSRKRNPQTHTKDTTMRWDFAAQRPEGILHLLKTFSDHGANSRVMDGFGVHAFKFVNKQGIPTFAKFHMLSEQPFRWFNSTELELISAIDPDYATRDLYNAIENKNYPKWKVFIQVMTPEQALKFKVNPFDATKIWREDEGFPLIPLGEMVLDENPFDQFSQMEEAAFSPERLVPGIEPSPDRLLHARMFSYPDAQRYRLGVNFARLEINRPIMTVRNYIRDGFMIDTPNGGGAPNYFPNSFHGPGVNTSNTENVFHVSGMIDRVDTVNDVEDNFRLAWLYLYKDLTAEKRLRVAQNLAGSLAKAVPEAALLAIRNLFDRLSADFGRMVRTEYEKKVQGSDN